MHRYKFKQRQTVTFLIILISKVFLAEYFLVHFCCKLDEKGTLILSYDLISLHVFKKSFDKMFRHIISDRLK